MKRFTWLLVLNFVLLMSFGMSVQAEPKEMTEVVTAAGYVTPEMLPLNGGRYRVNFDAIGMLLSDTGSGLFHQATSRILGGFTLEKDKYNDEQGWGVYTLQDGDKVFFTSTGAGRLEPLGVGEGKVIETFTGGTGKCTGIKGSSTFTRHGLRPVYVPTEMKGLFYMKGTIKYTLP